MNKSSSGSNGSNGSDGDSAGKKKLNFDSPKDEEIIDLVDDDLPQ